MNQDEVFVIYSIIKENLSKLLTEKTINVNEIKKIKEKIRQRIKNPKFNIKTNKIAELLIVYLINIKKIQNQEDLNKFLQRSGFLNKYCIIKDYSTYEDKVIIDPRVDSEILKIVDTKTLDKTHEELKKTQIVKDVIEEEANKQIQIERQKLKMYQSCIDIGLERSDEEIINEIENVRDFPYLEQDFEWFKEIGLKSDPFPSREGLEFIDQNLYDIIITQTSIFRKYIHTLNSNPDLLLNKSIIIYGEWGCGKTTFFDYFGYKCLQKDFFPIQILLNAEGSLQKLKDAFRSELFRKMAEFITQVSSQDPRSYLQKRDDDDITILFEIIRNKYNKRGFFIFLDGLHKSQDDQNIPLKFLNELQNILGIFKHRNNKIGIFIAGSNDWKQNISYSAIFSGSIYQDEKIPAINENQAYDMLKKRIIAFSESPNNIFFEYPDIQRLFNTIKKTRATEITFRILIQEFLKRGFISENLIKFDLRLERDILQTISEILKEDKEIYGIFQDLVKKCEQDLSKFIKIQNVISHIYELRKISENDPFLLENKAIFQLLLKKNIVKKFIEKSTKEPCFWLEKKLFETFMKIEKRVKFSPRYYLDKILFEKPSDTKEIVEQDKNLNTLSRWIYTNPQYEKELKEISQEINEKQLPLLENIEKNFFEISREDLDVMDKYISRVLRFIYKLADEPFIIKGEQELYDIFRFGWLDNQELINYFNAKQNFKEKIKPDKEQNQHFLKIYKDAYDTQISRIGRYINYNNILKIGSMELTDYEKRILNQARAIYEESKYKKCIDRYFDLIEEKCREWLFNVMELIFGLDWKSHIPQKCKDIINKNKHSDKVKYGSSIPNENEFYYLSRGNYINLFLDKTLWNVYFSRILGTHNKEIISKLNQISQIAHKVKHNQKDLDLKDFAPNIKEGLENTANILKILNRGYKNLITSDNILLNKPNIFMCWSPQVNLNIVSPFILDDNRIHEIFVNLKEFTQKEVPLRGNYINLGDRSQIQQNFSCYYREFVAIICYLIKTDKIRIKEYEGSSFSFRLIT